MLKKKLNLLIIRLHALLRDIAVWTVSTFVANLATIMANSQFCLHHREIKCRTKNNFFKQIYYYCKFFGFFPGEKQSNGLWSDFF